MSKSLGNHIGLLDKPEEMFGKLMSIPDTLIVKYYELLTSVPTDQLKQMKIEMQTSTINPKDLKMALANNVVAQFHSEPSAQAAQEHFVQLFQKQEIPDEMPEHTLPSTAHTLLKLLVQLDLVPSSKEGQRLIRQGGVEVDGRRITDPFELVSLKTPCVVRAGKRKFVRITWA